VIQRQGVNGQAPLHCVAAKVKQDNIWPANPIPTPANIPNAICRFRAMANPMHARIARTHTPRPTVTNQPPKTLFIRCPHITPAPMRSKATTGIAVQSRALRKSLARFVGAGWDCSRSLLFFANCLSSYQSRSGRLCGDSTNTYYESLI